MYWRSIQKILKTEEQAKQNAARCFCITKNIPLPPAQSDGEDYVKFASSEPLSQPCSQPAWMASLTQQMRGSIDLSPAANQQPSSPMASSASSSSFSSSIRTKAESSVVCSQPSKQSQEAVQQSIPAHVDPNIVKKLENIHKMLKPTGVFVKSLPELYLKTYGESLGLDVFPYLQARKDCFNLEETIPGRIIVCPVTEATFKVEFNNNCNSRSSDSKEATSSPESLAASPASSAYSDNRQELQDSSGDTRLQLLEKGSELEVIFSYAYSSSEVYFQLALSEDIIYEIEEVLSQICVTPAPSDWAVPMVGDMVAASYQNGWYRAQICEVNSPKVKVYFFDYGNTESVDISELRPLPQEKVTQMTPPLALRCTLTPKQASFFRVDTHARLEELSTTNPVLRAVVLDNPDHCVVELQLQDGTPVDLHSIPDPLKVKQEQASQLSSSSEPDKLILPDTDAFAVYICQIRTECTVILRVVDTNYSDALDELEKEIADNFYLWPVPEEVKERQIFAAMVLATADEAEDECSIDQNKYHRVLVQHQNKDGSLTCYLPDHGDEETLHRNQLREIDSWLNRSLPYQAVLATLHGLDHVEEALKSITMEILLKLVNFTLPVYAVRYRNSQALEIDIVDTDKDQEVNVNESVKAALEEVREGLSQGKTLKDIMHTMFGSNSGSQADSSSATTPSAATEDDTDDVQASLGRLSVTGDGDEAQSKLKRVQNYVDDLLMNSPGQGAKLYTWNSSKQESPATAQLKALPPLPSYWSYAFFKSVSLYITWVESPSYFVAIPLEQQGALEKVEAAIAQYFSSSAIAAATLSEQGLYAVRSEGKYRRALYMGLVGGMAKIFFPDHHCYDTVEMGEILPLPEQFYSLPFLAYKMRLRAMKPYQCQDWPDKTVSWFKENYSHRALYAVIFSQDGRSASCKHTSGSASNIAPGTLAVRLIDTSGNDDVIVDEMMEQMEMAVNDSSQEQC
ncbi:hypothetical protein RRG08_002374 [Elysia crispata]|uniref:Tudor domain-containing protein n=1 Tax=Elysia crispata TaxID=231223 RepID=A0AAE1B4Y9_9GAST|nr:hypothetical protein RRG08_002374 [Elysia crispata]